MTQENNLPFFLRLIIDGTEDSVYLQLQKRCLEVN